MHIIDYNTPHGRAHTRAADVAFLLNADSRREFVDALLADPDPASRAARMRAEILDYPGIDVVIRDGVVTVRVQPEDAQTHPPRVCRDWPTRCFAVLL